MAIPSVTSLFLPLLQFAGDGKQHSNVEAAEHLASELVLTAEQQGEMLPSGKQPRFSNRIGWAATYLRKAGCDRSLGLTSHICRSPMSPKF